VARPGTAVFVRSTRTAAYAVCLVGVVAIAFVGIPKLASWPPLAPLFGSAEPAASTPMPDLPPEVPGLPPGTASATSGAGSVPAEVPAPPINERATTAPADRKAPAGPARSAAKRTASRSAVATPAARPVEPPRALDLSTTATPVAAVAPIAPVVPTRPEPDIDVGQAFEVTQVDVRPVITRQTYPQPPAGAFTGGQPEVVVVRVLVSRTGRATEVRVVRGSKASGEFDKAAVSAVREWSFTPAQRRSKAVSCWMHVGVSFRAG
jgi:protein TonB